MVAAVDEEVVEEKAARLRVPEVLRVLLVELERCRHLQHRVAVPRLHHHRREPGARLGGAVQAEAAPVARLRRCQAGERWWGGGTAAYE